MLDPARPTADFRRARREGSVSRVADPWAVASSRVRLERFVIWSAVAAVSLVWAVLLGWLLVQGVARALDWFT